MATNNGDRNEAPQIERLERLELAQGVLYEAMQGPDGQGHVRVTSLHRLDIELNADDVLKLSEFFNDVRRIGQPRPVTNQQNETTQGGDQEAKPQPAAKKTANR